MSLKSSKKVFNTILVDYISNKIDWTPTKKYTYKMCEFMLDCDSIVNGNTKDVVNYIDTLHDTFKLFDRYSKNLEKKDIYQYTKFHELYEDIQKYIGNFNNNKVRELHKINGKLSPGFFIGRYNDYEIYRIKDFNDASAYSGYCRWCVTKKENIYKDYTKNKQTFYFALKDGYQLAKPETNENTPLDNYGLSMLAIRVFSDGSNEITTRWNHQHFNANILSNDFEYLNKLFGIKNSEKLFSSVEKIEEKKIFEKYLDVARLRINLDVNPIYVFDKINNVIDDVVKITLFYKRNLLNIKTKTIMSQQWFDDIFEIFHEDNKIISFVMKNNRYNLINECGEIMCEIWFSDYIIPENKDFFFIEFFDGQHRYNTMDFDGKILNDVWFDKIVEFRTLISRVEINDKTTYINKNGKIIIKE